MLEFWQTQLKVGALELAVSPVTQPVQSPTPPATQVWQVASHNSQVEVEVE